MAGVEKARVSEGGEEGKASGDPGRWGPRRAVGRGGLFYVFKSSLGLPWGEVVQS